MAEPRRNEARRITGRHLVIDGPGALAEVDTADADRIVLRLTRGLERLGWGGAPARRDHGRGTTVGVRSWPDVLGAATRLVDWAISDDDDDELDYIARRDQRNRNENVRALLRAFHGRVFVGEDLVTVGLGAHSMTFPIDEAPSPPQVGTPGTIPMVLVTGTNGKTTTTRLLAHLAESAGMRAGRTSSDAVVIGDDTVERGDWTGPGAARLVLRDRRVRFAALETARGGILRRGIVMDGADAAIVTNVTPEHLGEWGVDDLNDMARTKLVIARSLRPGGALIVPAVSEPIAAVLPEVLRERPDLKVLTFASVPVPNARRPDGWSDGRVLGVGDAAVPLSDIPITFDGTARHNVENALAATLAALFVGLPGEAVNRGLRSFRPSAADNPGRMNTWRLPSGALVVVDFAHNADGVRRIAETVRRWPKSRRILLIGQAGDRPNRDIVDFAVAALALAPHRIVLKDVTRRLFDRAPMEVPRLMFEALLGAGVPATMISGPHQDEITGVRVALHGLSHDDVAVLLIHETLAAVSAVLAEHGATPIDP